MAAGAEPSYPVRAMIGSTASRETGFWSFVQEILREHGVVALVLIVVLVLFWKLIWRVWDRALKDKDKEVARIAEERDRYQKLVFERLLSCNLPAKDDEEDG